MLSNIQCMVHVSKIRRRQFILLTMLFPLLPCSLFCLQDPRVPQAGPGATAPGLWGHQGSPMSEEKGTWAAHVGIRPQEEGRGAYFGWRLRPRPDAKRASLCFLLSTLVMVMMVVLFLYLIQVKSKPWVCSKEACPCIHTIDECK